MLLIGDDPSYTDQDRPWIFANLKTVEPDPNKWYTQVTWEGDIRRSDDPTPIKNPRIFVFRLAAKPFGYTRGGISLQPDKQGRLVSQQCWPAQYGRLRAHPA